MGLGRSAKRVILFIAPPTVGGVFLASAFLKAVRPQETFKALEFAAHELRLHVPVFWAMMGLVVAEIAVGAVLVAGFRVREALWCSSALLILFLAWLFWLTISRAPIPCGCGLSFSFLPPEASRPLALTKAGLMLLVCIVCIRQQIGVQPVEATKE